LNQEVASKNKKEEVENRKLQKFVMLGIYVGI